MLFSCVKSITYNTVELCRMHVCNFNFIIHYLFKYNNFDLHKVILNEFTVLSACSYENGMLFYTVIVGWGLFIFFFFRGWGEE